MSCKQPHYCVCRGEWPCVFDKPIEPKKMTRKEEIREAAARILQDVKTYDALSIRATLIGLCNKVLELTAHESSPAPLESQEELWNEVWELIISGKAGDSENKLKYVESRFILTRRKEGYLES